MHREGETERTSLVTSIILLIKESIKFYIFRKREKTVEKKSKDATFSLLWKEMKLQST